MDRRDFIRVTSLAGGGMLLSFSGLNDKLLAKGNENATAASAIGDFLSIKPDGEILFQFTKHEMGQGVSTTMAMMLAEELCADWQKVKIQFPDADLKIYQNSEQGGHNTGGSGTTITMMPILRKAGATARHMLLEAAAQQWNVTTEKCSAENHFIINNRTKQKLAFGELAGPASKLSPPIDAKLKDTKSFQVIGKPLSAKLIPDIVTGKAKYGLDVNIPGALYAVVERCPVYRGNIKSYEDSEALQVAGVKNVVTTKSVAGVQGAKYPYDVREGIAIVADTFWAAQKGREKLKVEWDVEENGGRSLEDFEKLAKARGERRVDPVGFVGDENAIANLDHVKQSLRETYIFPYQLHSVMEPLNCTAHFKGDSCEVWIGTQSPDYMINEIVRVFGLSEEHIKVHLYQSGGGFGRRYFPDMAIETLCISREAGNIPVKMVWTREDDQQTNFAHCYQRMDYQASIDEKNELYAWYEKESRTYTWGSTFAWPQLTWFGYNVPNIRYDFEDIERESLVQSTAWRAVMGNGWAFSECFMDEVAAHVKKDPYEFRLSLLREGNEANIGHLHKVSNTRLMGVLKLAVAKSDWGKPMGEGKGRGLAVYPYMHGNSYCAMVVEVTVRDNKINVDKVVCAVDCGLVVNPSGVKNQIEGGIIWGLTAVLYGGMEIENGRATKSNFHQNRVIRMNECPEMEVHFVENAGERPWGVGELSNPVIVPAVLNAIYAATGKRVRKLPATINA